MKYSDLAMDLKASEIRELLKLTTMPQVISFAGGLPAPELFPTEELKKVDEEVLTIQCKLFLSCYEGEASSQLQQEVLQVVNQCLLQFSLIHMRIRLDLQELHYIGVFDDFFIFRFRLRCLYLSSNK